MDTLYLNGTSAQTLTLNSAGMGTVVGGTVNGFEYIKGNNTGNYFDARDYNPSSGVTLVGGAGNDTLMVNKGQLIGGAGSDLLVLKDVTSGVSASGGAGYDQLSFNDWYDKANVTLNTANFGTTQSAITSMNYVMWEEATWVTRTVNANVINMERITFGDGADSISLRAARVLSMSMAATAMIP